MANGFSITIGAVDHTTPILEKINKGLTALQAPSKNFGKQVEKFKELSGLNKVRQGFDGIVHSSLGAARSLTRVAEPLAAITGAASIGGFTVLLSKWAEFNTALGFTAQRMGVMPEMLGQLRASGALAGGSADAMQQGFDNLGQTLYDMANGQAPQAAYVLSRLGISLMDATGHARKAKDVMPQLADAIAHVRDPMAQARLATMLFGSAGIDMLPVLRQGSAGMERLRLQAERYGGTTSAGTAAALRFSEAQGAVGQAVVGLTDAIATQLAPVISPLLLDLADWIAKGRTSKFVTHDLGEGVKDFAAWLKTIDFGKVLGDVENFGKEVWRVLQYLDGWIQKLDRITGAPKIDPVTGKPISGAGASTSAQARINLGPNSPGIDDGVRTDHPTAFGRWMADKIDRNFPTFQEKQLEAGAGQQTIAYLQTLGWSRPQAAGIAGNIERESSFNPRAVGDYGLARGIGQWHPDRQQDFADWAGFEISDPRATYEKQLQFYSYELTAGKERKAGDMLRQAPTAATAGAIVSREDERPGDALHEMDVRGNIAQRLFDAHAAAPAAPAADTAPQTSNTDNRFADMIQHLYDAPPPASQTLSAGDGADGAPGANGRVDVTIASPPGVKTTARASGNVNMPKIATAMPASGPTSP